MAEEEPAGVDRMESVDVLGGIHSLDRPRLVDLRGQRELDEDPVDRVVPVELVDQLEQLLLGCVFGEPVVAGQDAGLDRGLLLQPDVDVGSRVVADEDRAQADLAELLDILGDLRTDALGQGLSVHQLRRHGVGRYKAHHCPCFR